MYGVEISCLSLLEIEDLTYTINFKNESAKNDIRKIGKLLAKESSRLFRRLEELAVTDDAEEDADCFIAMIDDDNHRHIKNIRNMSNELTEMLSFEPIKGNGSGRKEQLLWELQQIHSQVAALVYHDEHICWIEKDERDCRLCAIPKDLDERLYSDLWSKGIPTILTSGTLSAAGDFSRIKRSLGIERVSKYRVTETSKPSPFNYKENALIYISENMPFPNQRDSNYILAAANEIEQLVYASHGHAAVLFTSYKVMDMVWEHLEERNMPFPLFRLDKGGVREIEQFKKSGNGVLFAAGALWEGIDIPGDALSMLIIVKLPFAVPDPISEYERTLYDSMDEYKECVIKPEMLVKTKQGYGRDFRTEKDTGCVAFLDSRMNSNGSCRVYVLNGLPQIFM